MNDTLQILIKSSFGFVPKDSRHHFVADILRATDSPVKISEHLTWEDETVSNPMTSGLVQDGQVRVLLARTKSDVIVDEVRAQFNQRLKKMAKRTGPNLVRRDLRKKLVLLAWATQDTDPTLILTTIAKWYQSTICIACGKYRSMSFQIQIAPS